MIIRTLRLKQFRSYVDATFEFSEGTNVIIGPNGIGKTNVLEALYALATGKSFRVHDKEMRRFESGWFRLDGQYDTSERSLRYQDTHSPPKRLYIDEVLKKRITRELTLPVVLFEPDMLRMLSGSPSRRRDFLNVLLGQWFGGGEQLLRRYDRVLMQRNKILKEAYGLPRSKLDDLLFAWDVSFAELAAQITEYHMDITTAINERISHEYNAIAKHDHILKVSYVSHEQPDKQAYLQAISRIRPLEIARGHTCLGPHRSDFTVSLDGAPAEKSASRGEQRSIMLALKQIESAHLSELAGMPPLMLLDDVMSELDKTRQEALVRLTRDSQVIMTTAHGGGSGTIGKRIELG